MATDGLLIMSNGTLFTNNVATNWGNAIYSERAEIVYFLPAPPGHFLPATKCRVIYTICPIECYGKTSYGCGGPNISMTPVPAPYPETCGERPPYSRQTCPWDPRVNQYALGPSIIGKYLYTLAPGAVGESHQWPMPCRPGRLGALADDPEGQVAQSPEPVLNASPRPALNHSPK